MKLNHNVRNKNQADFSFEGRAYFLVLMSWEIFIPTKKGIPQKTGTFKLLRGINKRKGPGQSPPIPQPSPNRKDPIIKCQSIFPFWSKTTPVSEAKMVFFLKSKKKLHSLSHDGENNQIDQNSWHENEKKTWIPIFVEL